MKLHWSARSPYARKVMVFAHETGLAGRITCVPTTVAMTQPNTGLLRIHPLGKIPALVLDDGTALYDSAVICEYLDSLHDRPKLFPPSGPARWTALRLHALGNNLLDNLVPWRNETLRPASRQSPETLAAWALKTRHAVTVLDHEADALAAAPLHIGHVAIGCALGYLDFRFAHLNWRAGHVRIHRWYDAFAQRPAMQQTLPVDP